LRRYLNRSELEPAPASIDAAVTAAAAAAAVAAETAAHFYA